MSGLYKVTINREQRFSKYDAHGVKISDEVKKIPVTFCDLPYVTALMYATKWPDDAVIAEQDRTFAPSRGKYIESARRYDREGIPPKHIGSEDLTPADATHEAAMTGDFGAAITAELEATS